jgi:hypothetical protein
MTTEIQTCGQCGETTTDGLDYYGAPCHILCMERAQRALMAALPSRTVARSSRPAEGREDSRGRMTDRGEDN